MSLNDQPPMPGDVVISGSGPWDAAPGPPDSEREQQVADKVSDIRRRPLRIGGPSR